MKMKTKIKKLVCLMLSAMMVLAMSLTGYADEETYTITITNATKGHTYQAYQVFEGNLVSGVLTDIKWGNGVNSDNLLNALKTTLNNDTLATAAEVAEAMNGIVNESDQAKTIANVIANNISSTVSGTYAVTDTTGTISGLSAGYYFIKDTDTTTENDPTSEAFTRYILKVTDDIAVNSKSSVPSVEKKVLENTKDVTNTTAIGFTYPEGYNDVADYNIGDTVEFMLVGTLPTTYADYTSYQYKFTDTLSEGLTFTDTDLGNVTITLDTLDGTDLSGFFTVAHTNIENANGVQDVITITANSNNGVYLKACEDINADSKIVVHYTATLNSEAIIGLPGNPNKVDLTFSNNPNLDSAGRPSTDTDKTPEDHVIVFTYELDVTKVDKADTNIKLNGAKFQLYRYKSDNTTKEYAMVDTNHKVTGWTENPDEATTTLTSEGMEESTAKGLIQVIGLDHGTYYLHETAAPEGGYNVLTKDVKVEITATTTNDAAWTGPASTNASNALSGLTIDSKEGSGVLDTGIVSMNVENGKGATLPSTGGIGTTIFYIIGGLMMLGAAIVLITKKRVADND